MRGTNAAAQPEERIPPQGLPSLPVWGWFAALQPHHRCHPKVPWGARALWHGAKGGLAALGPFPCLVCVIAHHRSELGRSNNNKLVWYLRGNCA